MTESYRVLAAAAERLSEDDLASWSRCRGWTRADVLFHVPLDAQGRILLRLIQGGHRWPFRT